MKRFLLAVACLSVAAGASAEPQFLSKQYTRCTTCHYSPTGGGLLTAYGRSLSNQELSTFSAATASREHEALFGILGKRLGALQVGATFRPAHLDVTFPGGSVKRNFIMNGDVMVGYRKNGWTAYGEFGRQGRAAGPDWNTYEHWVSYQSQKGFGIRAGRFLAPYGVNLADHTTFTRRSLGFDVNDQVYGVELSKSSDKNLFQISAGPGRADSLLDGNGTARVTVTGRAQFDLGSSKSVVFSALHKGSADHAVKETAGGVSFGFAPTRRWSIWTEAQARSVERAGGVTYLLANETSFEAYKGLWLKFTPQLRTNPGDASAGVLRTGVALDWFVRSHWNVGLLYYRDKDRLSESVSKTWLAQLQIYL